MKIETLMCAAILSLLMAIPSLGQERELVQQMERLEIALVELSQQRDELSERLEIAADRNQEGNVMELKGAIKGNAARMKEVENGLAELRSAMKRRAQDRNRLQRNERERAERDRELTEQDRQRAQREREEQQRDRDRRERAERGGSDSDVGPEIRMAINKLEHVRHAMGHLREAGMNDMAEMLERQAHELGVQVEQAMARSRRASEEERRDRAQQREAVQAERRRSEQRESSQRERDVDRRLEGVVKEFGAAIREMRNDIRELRNQMEQMKRNR